MVSKPRRVGPRHFPKLPEETFHFRLLPIQFSTRVGASRQGLSWCSPEPPGSCHMALIHCAIKRSRDFIPRWARIGPSLQLGPSSTFQTEVAWREGDDVPLTGLIHRDRAPASILSLDHLLPPFQKASRSPGTWPAVESTSCAFGGSGKSAQHGSVGGDAASSREGYVICGGGGGGAADNVGDDVGGGGARGGADGISPSVPSACLNPLWLPPDQVIQQPTNSNLPRKLHHQWGDWKHRGSQRRSNKYFKLVCLLTKSTRTCLRPKKWGGLGIKDLDKFSRADRSLFFCSTVIQVGNGKNTPFWEERWLQEAAPKDLAPSLYQVAKFKKRSVHIKLSNSNRIRSLQDIQTAAQLVEFTMLFMTLSSVNLTDQEDSITWRWITNDCYTVSSAYDC
jgi:hypothetical protein